MIAIILAIYAILERMSTPADRIRGLMDEHGLTQAEFAARVGLDGPKLSKSLNGVRRFSLVNLANIAEEFDVSLDWLHTGEESELVLAARRTADAPAGRAVAVARDLARHREDLASLGMAQHWRPLDARLPVGGRLVDQGSELADAALSRLAEFGLEPTGSDLATAIETAFGADVLVAEAGEGIDGLAVSNPDAKIILLAPSRIPARQRFTLAHELCHLLFADDQGVHLDEDIYSAASRTGDSEMRANAFAAAFLMPEALLRARVTRGFDRTAFCQLASDLRVSPRALSYRLLNLQLIDGGTSDRWGRITNQEAAEMVGQGPAYALAVSQGLQPRLPSLLVADTYRSYQDGLATLRPYANLIGQDVHELRRALEALDGAGG